MSEQGQTQLDAEKRAQHLAEMGLDDPFEDWERENPYDYMPYLVTQPKGSAKEIEAARSPNEGSQIKERLESKPNSEPRCLESSERASTVTFRFANACGNATGHSSK